MKLTKVPKTDDKVEDVQYNEEQPYVKDLITGERHPVTAHPHELVWRVWPVTNSRLYKLKYWGKLEKEPVTFENRSQKPFFMYLGATLKIPYSALSHSLVIENLEWTAYVGQKRLEYEEFIVRLKNGQITKNVV